MTREKRLEKAGYKVSYIMNTSQYNGGRCKVFVKKGSFGGQTFSSVSAAHRHYFGY